MGFLIHAENHSHGQSNGIIFLLGAIFNILANTDFSNLFDYTLKALIGGFVWLLYKLIADYMASRSRSKSKPSGKDDKEQ
jgi:hypothetical protein